MDALMDVAAAELPELETGRRSETYGIWLATLIVPALEHGSPGLVTKEELRWSGQPLQNP